MVSLFGYHSLPPLVLEYENTKIHLLRTYYVSQTWHPPHPVYMGCCQCLILTYIILMSNTQVMGDITIFHILGSVSSLRHHKIILVIKLFDPQWFHTIHYFFNHKNVLKGIGHFMYIYKSALLHSFFPMI